MGASETFLKAFAFIKQRKTAYQLAFTSPAGNEVLMDLVRFCRANRSCFDGDPRIHAVLEGRREVFLRIQEHLHLTPEQLQALYDRRNILSPPTEDDDDA
jgi:hypothetical protein